MSSKSKPQKRPMTPNDLRHTALSLPEASESAHMDHPDFRVSGKIFATLGWPDESWGVVMLSPAEQETLVRANPAVVTPVKGAWGKRGSTQVRLESIDETTLRSAIVAAWRNKAAKRLVAKFSNPGDA